MSEPTWVRDKTERQRLIDAYSRWATDRHPEDEWAAASVSHAIWHTVDPGYMLEFTIEVVNRLAKMPEALNYVGAGPLEELLGGDEIVMRRATEEARTNQAFRTALATVHPVRHKAAGFEELHQLTLAEQAQVPTKRIRKR